jgi:Zn-dependent protease with chaperone function
MTAPTPRPSPDQNAQILNAVSGSVELPQVTRRYVAGLLITAFAVLLIPLVYLGVITFAVGCLFILVRNADALFGNYPPFVHWLLIGLSAAFVVSLVLGMLKPFVARSSAIRRSRILTPQAQPLLTAYINGLCDAMNAPRPTQIHINCDLNAGAEYRRGWLWNNRGISLHIGLPLVAGLSLRQFTGVLAHELGHFTQRTAMWLENMVRRTNQWFATAAYERDVIDEWIDRHCSGISPITIPFYIARAMIWLSRQILRGLAMAGAAISGLMCREMEFNADRCQVRIVGSRTLASTMRRLRQLNLAHQSSFRDIAAFHDEGRLPDDLVALSMANVGFITAKVKSKLQRMMDEEQTSLLDTHPSDRDRIRAASIESLPGIFAPGPVPGSLPASILFGGFRELSKELTEHYYRDTWKQKIPIRMLHPVEKLLERQCEEINAAKALRRYFQTTIPMLRPLPIPPESAEVPDHPGEAATELRACRDRMIDELPNYNRLTIRYRAAEETLLETIAAQSLLQAKLSFEPSEFHLAEPHLDAVTEKQARARDGIANLAARMLSFETEAGNRLSFALQLLHVPEVVEGIPRGDDIAFEVIRLLPEAQFVSHLISELPSLRLIVHRLTTLCDRNDGHRPSERVAEMIFSQMGNLRNRLKSIQKEMGNHLYPFDHAHAEATLQSFALPQIPGEQDLPGLIQTAEQMQSRLILTQSRLFARLAQAAEHVETAIGMQPLPELEDVEDR